MTETMLCTECRRSFPLVSFWHPELQRYVARCALCRKAASDMAAMATQPKPQPPAAPAPAPAKPPPKPRPAPAREPLDATLQRWDGTKNFRVIPDGQFAAMLAWTFENNPTLGRPS